MSLVEYKTSTRTISHLPNDPYLAYRTLSNTANTGEYTTETATGEIIKRTISARGEKVSYKLVTFTIDDPDNPKNWSKAYKWWITMVIAVMCFIVALCSSVITPGIKGVQEEFGVSREVALLSVTLFVVGFGIGPMAFAPMSEILGRRIIYVTTLGVSVLFIIPCALAKNIQTLLVCRALCGIAMSAPMTLVGGSLADLWKNEERGVPMAVFSAAPFIGPAIGPLIGGYLDMSNGWRWLYWIQLILAGTIYLVLTFTVSETYAPKILTDRAKKLRKETGDQMHVTEDEIDRRPFKETLTLFVARPFQLLFGELIVLLLSLYMSVLYGLLYMFFVAYPIVYEEGKHWRPGVTGLMFLPIAVGVLASAACAPLVNKHYLKIHAKFNGNPPPEMRLIPMMYSLLPDPHRPGSMLGGFQSGFGFIFLYNSCNNYLVDTYQSQAASALAAKTFLRSMWGASTVLFTSQMYHKMGYQWASTVPGFTGLACGAIRFAFTFMAQGSG
ncbi:MFS multidrug transporter [Tricharina praecox]|uniref:MFS multidrug transporter n=1 Tax=Tricharina praecox TaxID=43433 RepID=UPI0022206E98|nr:MFS multidrug transporter [Tricharina praecox]KAI5841257.1 MFS multidrug transporter [Tricharina praecox]